MSLEDIRSECSQAAGLLQPYVDGELESAEQERVASHLEHCRGCRSAVSEQQWVRATLRAIERERAPASLLARIGVALDEVDRDSLETASIPEHAADAATTRRPHTTTVRTTPVPMRRSTWSRIGSLFADVLRGGLVLAPAGAMAVGLFFVARDGLVSTEAIGSHRLGTALVSPPVVVEADNESKTVERARPGHSLPPLVTGSRDELQLVRAELGRAPTEVGASLRFAVVRGGQPTGAHLVDHQAPEHGAALTGAVVTFRGARYHLARTVAGDPMLQFERAGVAHRVVLERDQRTNRHGATVDAETPDFAFLLDYASSALDPHARAVNPELDPPGHRDQPPSDHTQIQ